MATTVFALANNEAHASQIIRRLHSLGVSNSEVSLLLADRTGGRELKHVDSTKAPEGAAGGAVGGAVVGGALGWIIGIGALAIPGVGPLIAAGPLLAAMSGVAAGGTLGGIAGALAGLGAPEYEATQYEGRVREGEVLLSVHTDSDEQTEAVVDALEAEEAKSISRATEASVPR